MQSKLPLGLTICVPVYNREALINRCLDSIINQTCQPDEVIISDNCSTDGTYNIASSYAKKNPNIRLIRNSENIGAIKNFHVCIKAARFRYVLLLGSDDFLSPDFIYHRIRLLKEFPDVSVISGPVSIFTNNSFGLTRTARYNYNVCRLSRDYVINNFYKKFLISYFCVVNTSELLGNFSFGEEFSHLGPEYTRGLGLDLVNLLDVIKSIKSNNRILYASAGYYCFCNHADRESESIACGTTGFFRTYNDYRQNYILFSWHLENRFGSLASGDFVKYRLSQFYYEVYRAIILRTLSLRQGVKHLHRPFTGVELSKGELFFTFMRSIWYTARHLVDSVLQRLRG